MCQDGNLHKYTGISLDLFCVNCEQFTLVILTPQDKTVVQLMCSKCKELMLLVQITNQRLANEIHLYNDMIK